MSAKLRSLRKTSAEASFCLMLTSMPRNHVARALSSLVAPLNASVNEQTHRWLPEGLLNAAEPKLGETQDFL